jgi:integrase
MRGQGRIYRRNGSAFWWCAYYLRGKQYRQSTGETDVKKALKFLNRKIMEVGADKIGAKVFVAPKQERVTINEILADLVEHYKRGGKKGIPREVSPQMKSHLQRLRDFFGTSRAMFVGSKDVEAFRAQLKTEKKANATINRSLQLLSQAYKYAVNSDPPKLNRALKIERLDESGNRRKGKFTPAEAEMVACSLPPYMADVARFAYETGARASEILKLHWSYVDRDGINVPGAIIKNREDRSIALTEEIEEILNRRRRDTRPGCDLIFHHLGQQISDYRKCWHTACVSNGLGAYYCRACRDAEGRYVSQLDAEKKCPCCGKKWEVPKYIGRIFHDFRRSASYEMWKAGSSEADCMKATGHKTASMFKRYADLFSKEEDQARQREVQARRREWRKSQPANVVAMPKRAVQ